MTDEQQPIETTPEPNPVEEWLRTASPDEIMKHDRIRGIFGSRIQQEREATERRVAEQAQKKATEDAKAELERLAREDWSGLSERILSDRQKEKIAADLAQLKSSTRTEMAETLGRGFKSLPEWDNMTPAEQEKLANAVLGRSDDDVLAAFTVAAVDIIAERRASGKVATWTASELAKEREAIRQEENSKRVKTSARPALQRNGAEPAKFDPTQLPDKEYNQWYTGPDGPLARARNR